MHRRQVTGIESHLGAGDAGDDGERRERGLLRIIQADRLVGGAPGACEVPDEAPQQPGLQDEHGRAARRGQTGQGQQGPDRHQQGLRDVLLIESVDDGREILPCVSEAGRLRLGRRLQCRDLPATVPPRHRQRLRPYVHPPRQPVLGLRRRVEAAPHVAHPRRPERLLLRSRPLSGPALLVDAPEHRVDGGEVLPQLLDRRQRPLRRPLADERQRQADQPLHGDRDVQLA